MPCIYLKNGEAFICNKLPRSYYTYSGILFETEVFFTGIFKSKQVIKAASGSKNNVTELNNYLRLEFFVTGIFKFKQVIKAASRFKNNVTELNISSQSFASNVHSNPETSSLDRATRTLIEVLRLSNTLYFRQIIY